MLTLETLSKAIEEYSHELKVFFYQHGVVELLQGPIDHLAIKGRNSEEYEQYVEMFLPLSKRLSYAPMDGRRLATAELFEPIKVGELGETFTVEIMEPRPNAIVTTMDKIDHIEIYKPDFAPIKERMQARQMEFKDQSNPNHTALVVQINDYEQEVKFTTTSLVKIVEPQFATGESIIIKG